MRQHSRRIVLVAALAVMQVVALALPAVAGIGTSPA
jgi:hypothetical protein